MQVTKINGKILTYYGGILRLTEVMRQRGDATLIDLLNNVRIARPQPSDLTLLQSKTFSTAGRDFHHVTYI